MQPISPVYANSTRGVVARAATLTLGIFLGAALPELPRALLLTKLLLPRIVASAPARSIEALNIMVRRHAA